MKAWPLDGNESVLTAFLIAEESSGWFFYRNRVRTGGGRLDCKKFRRNDGRAI